MIEIELGFFNISVVSMFERLHTVLGRGIAAEGVFIEIDVSCTRVVDATSYLFR